MEGSGVFAGRLKVTSAFQDDHHLETEDLGGNSWLIKKNRRKSEDGTESGLR